MIEDLDVRRKAIFTPNHTFVWASAGTGKTHTLTLRALYQLLKLGAPGLYTNQDRLALQRCARKTIRSVVLTTFTRKAAAEMQERLYHYLDLIAQTPSLDSLCGSKEGQSNPLLLEIVEDVLARIPGGYRSLRSGVQALAERASELQISTIHSLAVSILRRHPLEAGLKPGVRFAQEDEDDVDTLRSQMMEFWWQNEAFSDRLTRADLGQVLEQVPAGDLHKWVDEVCRQPWIVEVIQNLTPDANDDRSEVTLAVLEDLISGLRGVRAGNVSRVVSELEATTSRIRAGDGTAWLDLANLIYSRRNYLFIEGRARPKAVLHALMSLPAETQRGLQNYLTVYKSCLRGALLECGGSWTAWVRLLERFRDWAYSDGMEKVGVISFDQMIAMTVDLLSQNEGIRRSEWTRLRAVLVDEFQDTDNDQLDLLVNLLRTPAGSNYDIQGFFVGDVKQSIYRFRGVDVGVVRDFFENYESIIRAVRPKDEYHLRTNFRSSHPITSFVNTFFEKEFPIASEEDRLVPFSEGKSVLPQWLIMNQEAGQMSVERSREVAAEATARAVMEHIKEHPAPDGGYREVLVLARSNRELDAILPVLNRAGIPVSAAGARTFYRHHEVLDLLNLLIALHHPKDSLAVAAVLRSPLIGLSDEQIHQILEQVPPERLFLGEDTFSVSLPDWSRRRILKIRELARLRREKPPLEWLHSVRSFVPFSAYAHPADREGRSIVRLNRLLEAFLAELLQGTTPPLIWLLKQRERAAAGRKWDQDFGEDVSIFDDGVDAVRVMTIHKAKGLEGDFVIVYGWQSLLEECRRGSNGSPRGVLTSRRSDGSVVRALSLQWGPLRIVTENYLEAVQLEKSYAMEEAQRLAYVATTRARKKLFLLDSPGRGGVFDCARFRDSTGKPNIDLLTWVPESLEAPVQGRLDLGIDWAAFRSLWSERQRMDWRSKVTILRHPTDRDSPTYSREEDEAIPRRAPSSLEVGQLVHVYLEQKLREGFDRAFLEDLWSKAGGSDGTVVHEASERLKNFFSGRSRDHQGRPFMERLRRGNILGQEVSVFLSIDGQPWHGIIDLIMAEAGAIFAIDFKTGSRRDPLPETYLLQQEVYSVAASRLFPGKVVGFEFWWMG